MSLCWTFLWLSLACLVRVLGLSFACLKLFWDSPGLSEAPACLGLPWGYLVAVLGLSWVSLGLSWGCLVPVLGFLGVARGSPGTPWGSFGAPRDHPASWGSSWALLGLPLVPKLSHLGPKLSHLGPKLSQLGRWDKLSISSWKMG